MLASGRPTPGMRRYEEELELEKYGGYLLSFNGGRIINCRTGEIVYQKMFPSVLIPKLYHFAKQNDCGLITYYGDKIILGTRMDDYVALESRINGMKVQTVDDFLSFVDFDVNKMLMTAPPDKAEEYEGNSRLKAMIDNGDEITAKIVFDLAKENDYLANTVVDEVCFYLGLATANLSNALNPEYLVIGGGVSAAGEFLLKRVKQNFEKFAFPTVRTSTQLKLAELGNDAGVIGAASLARQFVNAD